MPHSPALQPSDRRKYAYPGMTLGCEPSTLIALPCTRVTIPRSRPHFHQLAACRPEKMAEGGRKCGLKTHGDNNGQGGDSCTVKAPVRPSPRMFDFTVPFAGRSECPCQGHPGRQGGCYQPHHPYYYVVPHRRIGDVWCDVPRTWKTPFAMR
jgi:hypothetical protein